MKFLKALAAAAVAALVLSTAQAQQIPATSIGPMNADSVVCNPSQSSVAYGFDCNLGPGFSVTAAGVISTNGADNGAIFALSGGTGSCATTSTLLGGSTRGTFKCTGTAGAGTILVTLPAATNGWMCDGNNITQGTAITQSAVTTTSATLKLTTVVNTDTLNFACFAY